MLSEQSSELLTGDQSVEKIKSIVEQCHTCLFTTMLDTFPNDTRPMSAQTIDDQGRIWFISAIDSQKNIDIAKDDRVMLTFQDENEHSYLALYGHATTYTDQVTKQEHWTAFASAWFDGVNDPKLSVICVQPFNGRYWQTSHGKVVTMFKLAYSVILGEKVEDIGVDGVIHL